MAAFTCPYCKSKAVKHGVFIRKRTRTHVQRYRCLNKKCEAKSFSDQTLSLTCGQHRPDLNDKILEDVGNGKGIRRMAMSFRTTKKTVQRKIKFLAPLCEKFNKKHMSQWTRDKNGGNKPRFAFDEMYSIEADSVRTLSVPVVAEIDSHFIVGSVAVYLSSNSHYPSQRKKDYEAKRKAEIAQRPDILKTILSLCRLMKPQGRVVISTDMKPGYSNYVQDGIGGAIVHSQVLSNSSAAKAELFSVNNIMACLRADKAMLREDTWHICKDKEFLSRHLSIYAFYSNYQKMKGYKEPVIDEAGNVVLDPKTGKVKKKVVYRTPAMHLGIFDRPVGTKFMLENC